MLKAIHNSEGWAWQVFCGVLQVGKERVAVWREVMCRPGRDRNVSMGSGKGATQSLGKEKARYLAILAFPIWLRLLGSNLVNSIEFTND